MGLISLSLPSDGDTADAADVNTPFNTIATVINGNLDNDNIKSAAGINTSKLASDGFLAAWQSWTPTWTNVSGGTTNYAKYVQIGKTVHYRIKYTMAGANVSGLVSVTVPVAMHSDYGVVANVDIVGIATFLDVGSAIYHGVALVDSGKLNIRVSGSGGTYSNPADLSSTVPFTWGSTDILSVSGTYEAA